MSANQSRIDELGAIDWEPQQVCECHCTGTRCTRPAQLLAVEHAPCGRLFYGCAPCVADMRAGIAEQGDLCDRCGVTFYEFDVCFPRVVPI